jgi:hypothetical protein
MHPHARRRTEPSRGRAHKQGAVRTLYVATLTSAGTDHLSSLQRNDAPAIPRRSWDFSGAVALPAFVAVH